MWWVVSSVAGDVIGSAPIVQTRGSVRTCTHFGVRESGSSGEPLTIGWGLTLGLSNSGALGQASLRHELPCEKVRTEYLFISIYLTCYFCVRNRHSYWYVGVYYVPVRYD